MAGRKITAVVALLVSMVLLTSCGKGDTYELALNIYHYKLYGEGYEETLEMAKRGNYDANCRDCFKGFDTSNVSLFAYACSVDYEIARAVYDNGADIESSNYSFYETPLLAALDGNRNNTEIVYWLIDEGADINAVAFDKCCVFNYLRYWEDNEETQELITYFMNHCDMEYLERSIEGSQLAEWDEMWDKNGKFIFYE